MYPKVHSCEWIFLMVEFKNIYNYYFYLVVLGLSRSMWDLVLNQGSNPGPYIGSVES